MSPDAISEIIRRLDNLQVGQADQQEQLNQVRDSQIRQQAQLDRQDQQLTRIVEQATETNGRVRRLEAWQAKVDSWRDRIGEALTKVSDAVRQLELWRAEIRGAWNATRSMGGRAWLLLASVSSAVGSGVAVFLITRALS